MTDTATRTAWPDGDLLAFDLEATGVDPNSARMIEVALVLSKPDGTVETLLDAYVDCGVQIPEAVTKITGIDADTIADSYHLTTDEALTLLLLALSTYPDVPIVIYNAPYDWRLLQAEIDRALTRPGPVGPNLAAQAFPRPRTLIDPLVLDRHVDKWRKGTRKLGPTCALYGVDLDDAHRARADAVATVELARAIGTQHRDVGDLDGPDLHALQVEAFAEWRDSYNRWRAGKGMDPIPDDDWPGT